MEKVDGEDGEGGGSGFGTSQSNQRVGHHCLSVCIPSGILSIEILIVKAMIEKAEKKQKNGRIELGELK